MKARREAYAKINLFLSVGNIRPDGFHDISSVMHAVSLSDSVTVELTKSAVPSVSLKTNGSVPMGPENLAWRACDAFFRRAEIGGYDVAMTVEKRIPVAAGLAGGSSDAAAVLLLLNECCGGFYTLDELLELGASVGSDVPFCIVGSTALAEGRGELLTLVPAAGKYKFLIANGGSPVSTAEAYRSLDLLRGGADPENVAPDGLIRAVREGAPLDGLLYNSFEDVILRAHPEATRARSVILDCGGAPLLCGSGPSVFGVFEDDKARKKAKEILESEEFLVFSCESV